MDNYYDYNEEHARLLKRAMLQGIRFEPGTIRLYGRKSTPQERGKKICRSVEQQMKINFETCSEWNLPATEADVRAERQGLGGELLPTGMTIQVTEGDEPTAERRRPTLGTLLREVSDGKVAAIVVWSEDRLWRSSKLCAALLEFFQRHNVYLFDRSGPIDFRSVEGFQAVVNRAVAAEAHRKMCSENAKRGQRSNRTKGQLVINPDCLGFRTAGRFSREVCVVPEEIQLVVRIFRLFVHGDGQGPYSVAEICRLLMSEGVTWPRDLQDKVAKKRNEATKDLIYCWQIRKVLTDCKYQGRQVHKGKEWECPAFLIEGQPAVPTFLYEAARAKLASGKKAGNATRKDNLLTGILRCGLCGQGLHVSSVNTRQGPSRRYYKVVRYGAWSWCTHCLPAIRESILNGFVNQELWPMVAAMARQQLEEGSAASLRGQIAGLERRRAELQKDIEELQEMSSAALRGNMEFVAERDRRLRTDLRAVEQSIVEQRTTYVQLQAAVPAVESLEAVPDAMKRDCLRAVIEWAALIPIEGPPMRAWGRDVPGRLVGKILFSTVWGSLFTAIVERDWHPDSIKRRLITVRIAEPHEMILSVDDMPDLEAFAQGLERAFNGLKLHFDPTDLKRHKTA